jgi:hypothetical protein
VVPGKARHVSWGSIASLWLRAGLFRFAPQLRTYRRAAIAETLVGMWHGKTATDSIPDVGGGSLEGILVVGVMMFVVLIRSLR